jgi:ketosteroid isomerase-like protein
VETIVADDEQRLTELLDREAIRDCMYRYCRGIDRADEDTLRSAYWPDATDQHGRYSGPVEGFFALVKESFKAGARNIHQVSNILIDFKSETDAVVESYFNALQRGADKNGVRQFHLAGRYCDLFEKRGRDWRIAQRVVVYDWVEEQLVPEGTELSRFGARQPVGTPFPEDPIYRLLGHDAPDKEPSTQNRR